MDATALRPKEAITIANELVSVTLRPDAGMTLTSICRVGEWQNLLWERRQAAPHRPTRSIGEAGGASIETLHSVLLGGWFEMSPHSGLPGWIRGKATMHHGEAVRLPWRVVAVTKEQVEAITTCIRYPLALTRCVSVSDDSVLVASEIEHMGTDREWVTHGEHPCFARDAFPGGRIHVRVRRATVLPALDPDHATVRAGEFDWPHAQGWSGDDVDLSVIPNRADGSHDHVLLELDDPRIEIRTSDGRGCTLVVDLVEHPYALYWRCYQGSHSPTLDAWDVFAMEPLSAPARSVDDAVAANALTAIDPGAKISYACNLNLGPT